MIDGSPVTFEFTDHGLGYRPFVITMTASGEGFYVEAVSSVGLREDARMGGFRVALERAGVDTATAEYHDWGVTRFGKTWEKWHPVFPSPTMAESVERITEWNREHGAAPSYPNETLKSWSHAQKKQPVGITPIMEFECPTEIDTYDQKMAKAAKWARNRIGVEKIIGGGIWALDLLAGLAEDFVKTPAPSTEPTSEMIARGTVALVESLQCNVPLDVCLLRVWRAMEKARTK